jgi:hypothetical protein
MASGFWVWLETVVGNVRRANPVRACGVHCHSVWKAQTTADRDSAGPFRRPRHTRRRDAATRPTIHGRAPGAGGSQSSQLKDSPGTIVIGHGWYEAHCLYLDSRHAHLHRWGFQKHPESSAAAARERWWRRRFCITLEARRRCRAFHLWADSLACAGVRCRLPEQPAILVSNLVLGGCRRRDHVFWPIGGGMEMVEWAVILVVGGGGARSARNGPESVGGPRNAKACFCLLSQWQRRPIDIYCWDGNL